MQLNQATASLRRVPFELFDNSGAPVTGASFTNPPATGEVQLSKAGGSYTDVTGSVVEIGSGSYYYQGVLADTNTLGLLILKVNKSGSRLFKYQDEVTAGADATAIANAVWGFAHQSGRTVKGAIKRLDQLLTGKNTGLKGALWRLFDIDGTTPLVEASQNTSAGTRDAASTIAGD